MFPETNRSDFIEGVYKFNVQKLRALFARFHFEVYYGSVYGIETNNREFRK